MFLPPANEVCEGYVFTPVCQSFCSQGEVSSSMHAEIHIPPGSRHPPEVDPPKADPSEADTPPPSAQCMLGDTGTKRAVRILLECILVILRYSDSCSENYALFHLYYN